MNQNIYDLKGKVALITGAAHPQSIGRAIAERLGASGARILIADIDKKNMDAAVEDLKSKGITASCYEMDVSKLEEVEFAVQKMIDEVGTIDILVNNVGGSSRITREELIEDHSRKEDFKQEKASFLGISNVTVEQWNKIMEANLYSVFYVSRTVLPHMKKRGYGRIVNFSSVAAHKGVGWLESFSSGPYVVAKAAIIGFTRQLAIETAPYGITVNAIAPGVIRSSRGEMLNSLPKEQYDGLIKSIPLERFGDPDEVASVVLGLCTDQFKYVTGQTINVNGGMYFS
jgi:3-oxoacyl-[acyl-carrier protein] reductase